MASRESLRILSKYSLLVLLGISTWIPILVINFFYWVSKMAVGYGMFPEYLPQPVRMAFFGVFFVANYIIIDQIVRQIEKWDVIDLLWKLVVIGVSMVSVTFLLDIIEGYMSTDVLYKQVIALSASVRLYALVVFCLSTLFIYRKLILYQKNKRKVISWQALQVIFLLGLVRLFMGQDNAFTTGGLNMVPVTGEIQSIFTSVVLPMFLGVSLFLSANVNWSAYLNTNQKLKSLFLILILVLLFVAFFFNFPLEALPDEENEIEAMTQRFLILGLLFVFPLIYTLFSGLVIIFNLPTSSVFEQRSSELATIQRINQSIQSNLDSEEILRTLLDAALLTSNATGGWIETFQDGDFKKSTIPYLKQITQDEIERLQSRENLSDVVVATGKYIYIRNLRKHKSFRYVKTRVRSILALPIMTSKHPVGVIYLLNDLPGSFEEATILSMVSLTEQSGISIENAELVARSIDLEIYREQLRVAKTFQDQILPQALPGTDKIEFFVMGQEVDEIGGDFYDVMQKGNVYKLAMGDVSGKGTSAAFYMAETKGIFQALTQLDMGVRDFVLTANKALSNCLRKGSFMTLTYVHIDMDKQLVELLRAGHCQTLYYHANEDKLKVLEAGGPGLAILRSDAFADHIGEPERLTFGPGDLMILFTDGMIEAKNGQNEEFGFDRLHDIVFRLRHTDSRLVVETLVQQVMAFNGGKIEDDYSIMAVKFL